MQYLPSPLMPVNRNRTNVIARCLPNICWLHLKLLPSGGGLGCGEQGPFSYWTVAYWSIVGQAFGWLALKGWPFVVCLGYQIDHARCCMCTPYRSTLTSVWKKRKNWAGNGG